MCFVLVIVVVGGMCRYQSKESLVCCAPSR